MGIGQSVCKSTGQEDWSSFSSFTRPESFWSLLLFSLFCKTLMNECVFLFCFVLFYNGAMSSAAGWICIFHPLGLCIISYRMFQYPTMFFVSWHVFIPWYFQNGISFRFFGISIFLWLSSSYHEADSHLIVIIWMDKWMVNGRK